MKAYDFEYDGKTLGDMGYTICSFDGGGSETVSNGSQISLNTVSTRHGRKYDSVSSSYSSYIESVFQICKKECVEGATIAVSLSEERAIMRWLNRATYHRMEFLDDEWSGIFFEATFNVASIQFDGETVGFELTMTTNRPYAIQEYKSTITVSSNNATVSYTGIDIASGSYSSSQIQLGVVTDDEGLIYPKEVKITLASSGDLTISNLTTGTDTIINNCSNQEVIYLRYPVITSSTTHDLPTDFNWNFFNVSSAYDEDINVLSVNRPCTIEIVFESAVKLNV